jgi:polysaccharide biosynthesis/export protein
VHRVFFGALLAAAVLSTAGCGGAPELPPAPPASSLPSAEYRIGPGDSLNIFVREYEQRLGKYIREPLVTVIVSGFVGPIPDQVRIIGEASQPRSLPYRADMTVLDAVIAVGGLTRYAAGNDSLIIRTVNGVQTTYAVHLRDLVRDGDITSNVALQPGDILIIPQRLF